MIPYELRKTFTNHDGKEVTIIWPHVESVWQVEENMIDIVFNSGNRIRVQHEGSMHEFFDPEPMEDAVLDEEEPPAVN